MRVAQILVNSLIRSGFYSVAYSVLMRVLHSAFCWVVILRFFHYCEAIEELGSSDPVA